MKAKAMEKSDVESGNSGKIKEPPLIFSCRLSFFILCLFAGLNIIVLRVNINFALVCMVKLPNPLNNAFQDENYTSLKLTSDPPLRLATSLSTTGTNDSADLITGVGYDENEDAGTYCKSSPPDLELKQNKILNVGEFEWDKGVQANILGSFYFGYIFTNIIGGWASDKFGGRKSFIASMGILSFLTLFNPIASSFGPEFLFIIRFLQGISQGASLPLINVLCARWAGHTERAFLMGIAYGGISIGSAISNPMASIICTNFGWSYIFYFTGGLGIIWCFVAWFMLFDWPEDHPKISKRELEFLQKNRAVQPGTQNTKKLVIPWKSIMLSGTINAIHYVHFCTIWGYTTLAMYIPQYFKEILKMDISRNGILSSLPFIGMLVIHWFTGGLFDYLRKKNFCTVTTLRKAFNTIGIGSFAISLSLLSLIPCEDNTVEIVLVFLGTSLWQLAMMGGYFFSMFELAPRFAGIITGISNTFGVVPGFLCPALVAYLTQNGTREEWLLVFYIASALTGSGVIVYLVFGSSELQPWANEPPPIKQIEMKILEEKLIPPSNNVIKDKDDPR